MDNSFSVGFALGEQHQEDEEEEADGGDDGDDEDGRRLQHDRHDDDGDKPAEEERPPLPASPAVILSNRLMLVGMCSYRSSLMGDPLVVRIEISLRLSHSLTFTCEELYR